MPREYISNPFLPSSQKRIYDMDLVHETLAASFGPRSFRPPISPPFSDSPFNLFPVQTVLQMYLEIVNTRFGTWGVQFSWTIKALDSRVVHVLQIWRRGLIGSQGDGQVCDR